MLIHNRFRSSSPSTQSLDISAPPQPDTVEPNNQETVAGCVPRGKYYVCKLGYLTPCDSFSTLPRFLVLLVKIRDLYI